MSTAELATYTADDLLQMPDGDRYELVDGQLVETDMGNRASWIAGNIHTELNNYSQRGARGWALTSEAGIQCFPDDRQKVRRPDVFFVCRGRYPNEEVPEGFTRIPPDVAVEVISPNDLYYAVDDKVEEYLDAGVRLVWVVNPKTRTVAVHRARGGDPSRLGEEDTLTGEDVLPEFHCRVGNLFSPATAASSE
jgi:Uma2 family endonuclease